MPSIKAPTHTKIAKSGGGTEACYTFALEYDDAEPRLSFLVEEIDNLNAENLVRHLGEQRAWWVSLLTTFLQSSTKYFSKPYTVEQIQKIIKHVIQGTAPTEFPVEAMLTPQNIQIRSGVIWFQWKYTWESLRIDIPVESDAEAETEALSAAPLPVVRSVVDGVEELTLDDVPVDKNATDELFQLETPGRFYDKRKVKEARLKAKLAVYKAQNQMSKYYEKYGHELSDTDSESESEESEEDVQL